MITNLKTNEVELVSGGGWLQDRWADARDIFIDDTINYIEKHAGEIIQDFFAPIANRTGEAI